MKALLFCYTTLRKFLDDEMTIFAASAAFWIMISAVPFLMVILTAIQLFPGFDKSSIQQLLIQAAPDLPQLTKLIYTVTDDVFVKAPSAILSLTAILTLWSASTGVYGIGIGIRKIYGTRKASGYVMQRLSAMLFTLLFVAVLLLTLVLLVLGSSIQLLADRYLPLVSALISFILGFKALISGAVLYLFFLLLYHLLPGRTPHVRRQYPGALFATVGWLLFSYLFSIYFTYFKNISYMYGSLGALILLMFWLYAIICIIFLGAELNHLFALIEAIRQGRAHPAPPDELP